MHRESKKTGGKVKFTNAYKTFVQDLVAQDVDELSELLYAPSPLGASASRTRERELTRALRSYDADGYIYCCGNRFMPPAVQKSLTQCFIKGKKVSPEVAEEKVVDMYIKGRYNVGESVRFSGCCRDL